MRLGAQASLRAGGWYKEGERSPEGFLRLYAGMPPRVEIRVPGVFPIPSCEGRRADRTNEVGDTCALPGLKLETWGHPDTQKDAGAGKTELSSAQAARSCTADHVIHPGAFFSG